MRYDEYIRSLTEDQLAAYAGQVGTSVNYLITHLVPARKVPRKELMVRLANGASPSVNRLAVLQHFYPEMFEEAA